MARARTVTGTILGVVSAVVLACVGLTWWISQDVGRIISIAQLADPHPGDDGEALLFLAKSSDNDLDSRNRAVWALGRLRESRALPVLEAVFDGRECDHQRRLCQSELAKAMRRCADG